jgi:hypothetical protein
MTSLYEDKHPTTSLQGTGFKDAEKARQTIALVKGKPVVYQFQVINTMYYRAKHHPHQTPGMRSAMRVFAPWLREYRKTHQNQKRETRGK